MTWSVCTEGPRSPSPAGPADEEVGAQSLGQGAEPRSPASGDVTGSGVGLQEGLPFQCPGARWQPWVFPFPAVQRFLEEPKSGRAGGEAGAGGERWASLGPALDALQWQGGRLVRGAGLRGSCSTPRPHFDPASQLGPRPSRSLELGEYIFPLSPTRAKLRALHSDSYKFSCWGSSKIFCP